MASHFFIIRSLFLFSQRSLSMQFCPDLPMISGEEPIFQYMEATAVDLFSLTTVSDEFLGITQMHGLI